MMSAVVSASDCIDTLCDDCEALPAAGAAAYVTADTAKPNAFTAPVNAL